MSNSTHPITIDLSSTTMSKNRSKSPSTLHAQNVTKRVSKILGPSPIKDIPKTTKSINLVKSFTEAQEKVIEHDRICNSIYKQSVSTLNKKLDDILNSEEYQIIQSILTTNKVNDEGCSVCQDKFESQKIQLLSLIKNLEKFSEFDMDSYLFSCVKCHKNTCYSCILRLLQVHPSYRCNEGGNKAYTESVGYCCPICRYFNCNIMASDGKEIWGGSNDDIVIENHHICGRSIIKENDIDNNLLPFRNTIPLKKSFDLLEQERKDVELAHGIHYSDRH